MKIEIGKTYSNGGSITRTVIGIKPSYPGRGDNGPQDYIYKTNRSGYENVELSCYTKTMQSWAKFQVGLSPCKNCKASLQKSWNFCPYCGERI